MPSHRLSAGSDVVRQNRYNYGHSSSRRDGADGFPCIPPGTAS